MYVTCKGGILDNQWFSQAEWDIRSLAHERMRAAGSLRSRGAGDYTVTTQTIDHPTDPAIIGQIATYKWK